MRIWPIIDPKNLHCKEDKCHYWTFSRCKVEVTQQINISMSQQDWRSEDKLTKLPFIFIHKLTELFWCFQCHFYNLHSVSSGYPPLPSSLYSSPYLGHLGHLEPPSLSQHPLYDSHKGQYLSPTTFTKTSCLNLLYIFCLILWYISSSRFCAKPFYYSVKAYLVVGPGQKYNTRFSPDSFVIFTL